MSRRRQERRRARPAALDTDHGDTLAVAVAGKAEIADGVMGIELRRTDGGRLPDWAPGAHIDLVLEGGVVRQYSLCGDPFEADRYRIGVLREPDGRGGSEFIHNRLQIGDRVGVGGPRNNFALVPSPHYSFVAGGVGITALIPMLRAADQLGAEWRLLYLGRSRDSMAFLDELPTDDRVTIHAADELGPAALEPWIPRQHVDMKLYACGPVRLLDEIDEATRDWRRGWVRAERFSPRQQEARVRTTPFEVTLVASGLTVTVSSAATVADAIRGAGVKVLTSCGRGTCGTCEATVLAGEPDHRDSLLTEAEREANDCMFPCVSRSRSDRLVLDL